MSVTAVVLLLIAAFTHAGWNFISKKQHPTLAFYLVANTIGVFCVLPVLPWFWNKIPLIPPCVWIFVVLSGFFLAVYMAALAGAYRTGDMSIAYPLARSLPVIFITIITILLGKGHEVGWWLTAGIILVLTGCLMLPMKMFRDFRLRYYLNLCCLLAVLAAIGIAAYTIMDDTALRYLRELPGKPFHPVDGTLVYMVLEGISTSFWKGIFILFSLREKKNLVEILCHFKGPAALTGIGIYLTYGLVLLSMNYVTNVSYVAAFRQLSIPLGVVMGIFLLKEAHYMPKVFGVAIIFAGLILVGTG
jgi:drug/metabolite transporter (DMT)-like permease